MMEGRHAELVGIVDLSAGGTEMKDAGSYIDFQDVGGSGMLGAWGARIGIVLA